MPFSARNEDQRDDKGQVENPTCERRVVSTKRYKRKGRPYRPVYIDALQLIAWIDHENIEALPRALPGRKTAVEIQKRKSVWENTPMFQDSRIEWSRAKGIKDRNPDERAEG